ncbi:MAG: CIA30 family protein [Chloroflexi bacterium]|nr:CIA30 family protein [Chloroflexota bacterium]
MAELLTTLLRQRQLSPRRLAELTSIPEDTIKGWLLGRGRSIREWERAIVVVAVLDLSYSSTLEFFNAAKVSSTTLERLASVELSAAYRELQPLVEAWAARHEIIQQLRASSLQPLTSTLPTDESARIEAAEQITELPTETNHHAQPLPAKPVSTRSWRFGLIGLNLMLLLGIGFGVWWILRPSVLEPWSEGEWGSYTDNDAGGNSVITPIISNCIIPDLSPNEQLVVGCLGMHGTISGPDGYAGIYRTLSATPNQTVDLSQYQAIGFLVRGSGQHVHVGLEVQTDPNQSIQEHVASFTLTPNWQYVRIPFSSMLPLVPGSQLDLTTIRAISWSITQGDQNNVEIIVDQIRFER